MGERRDLPKRRETRGVPGGAAPTLPEVARALCLSRLCPPQLRRPGTFPLAAGHVIGMRSTCSAHWAARGCWVFGLTGPRGGGSLDRG